MFLRLFGYRFPLFAGAEIANQQNSGMRNAQFWSPAAFLLFTTAAFGLFYRQFTPEEQKDIIKRKPFFTIGLRN